jgi:cytochrome c-type protein NapC
MEGNDSRSGLKRLLQPSKTRSVLSLVIIGMVLGAVALLTFDATLHATSTEAFCTSCHDMDSPYAQYQQTSHFNNATGISASCSDCHVPQEFVPKMIRKVEAAREVWGTLTGIINTPEKYTAHAPAMKAREIARLKANDSQECRNCHNAERMLSVIQSSKAQRYHRAVSSGRKTCIDCHAGIAHPDNAG